LRRDELRESTCMRLSRKDLDCKFATPVAAPFYPEPPRAERAGFKCGFAYSVAIVRLAPVEFVAP
jgi:hypothetical protein